MSSNRKRLAILILFLVLALGILYWQGIQTERLLMLLQPAAEAQPDDPPTGWALKEPFPGLRFSAPVDLQSAPRQSRLFVVEQAGRVLSFSPTTLNLQPFLDLRSQVEYGGEQGLLGLAFDPNYPQNGYLYLNYTAPRPLRTVIARFTAPPGQEPPRADLASQKILLEIPQPYSNHNGGQLAFGPDGYLYIALGDGGAGGDPHQNAQNLESLLGKILRIDVHASGPKPYGIPKDNPLVEGKGRPELWAWGLRNPWRMSFDRAGRLWAGDVGQSRFEEIDLIVRGGNYGWRSREAFACFEPQTGCQGKESGLIDPVFAYDRKEGQCITGGYVYQGERLPALKGQYLFADYVNGRVWALSLDGDGTTPRVTRLIPQGDHHISSFGQDSVGELYLLDHGTGRIWWLVKG